MFEGFGTVFALKMSFIGMNETHVVFEVVGANRLVANMAGDTGICLET